MLNYSGCPNTGRPVFGYFHLCPVDKTSGYRVITRNPDDFVRLSDVRFNSIPASGYRTSGSIASNRTSDSRNQYQNLFQTGLCLKSGHKCPVIGRLRYSKRPITGRLCPVIGRPSAFNLSYNRTD